MHCNIVKSDTLGTVIVCGRKPKGPRVDCFSAPNGCYRPSVVQCDFIVAEGKTCDRHCCDKHSKHVGPEKDFCLEHWVQMGKPAYAP